MLKPMLKPFDRGLIRYISTGKTALHWAAAINNLRVTEELVKNKAKIDARDNKVIHLSCYHHNGYENCRALS